MSAAIFPGVLGARTRPLAERARAAIVTGNSGYCRSFIDIRLIRSKQRLTEMDYVKYSAFSI